jgi:hypothetical protein
MSKSYLDNAHIFFPQSENPNYTEQRAICIGWEWFLEVCNNKEDSDSKKKVRALLSTTSRRAHRIAYMIRSVILMKQNNLNNFEEICCLLDN